MKIAIISDLHSNFTAVEAVLKKIAELKLDEVICLGDIVGYGPNPKEVIDLLVEHKIYSILGNHDDAVLTEPKYFNRIPHEALMWTKEVLQAPGNDKYIEYLSSLDLIKRGNGMVFTHGVMDNNMCYVEDTNDLLYIFDNLNDDEFICFGGHSHQASVWIKGENDISNVMIRQGEEYVPESKVQKVWVNVGSVGQPRDSDWRSSFFIYDTESKGITPMRVEYDVDSTISQIQDIERLDNFLADRLRRGQ
ncbi:MAG: metallophosphoesterase family protein [Planctomycetes bacterium]|nr:metallophosphoesterase family protein [Planctomycetota bacterium]